MFSYSELDAVQLSPTKKDYYQIWNELLDVASKLSERWDPSSTNESDPGIVLLKVLTAIADRLNYSIDSNILEAYMPSAAQEASMRKLCDMLGYNMKYFTSATTTAKITYKGDVDTLTDGVKIEQFSNLKDIDGNINYITLDEISLTPELSSQTVDCMEGELVLCETDDDNIISLRHLDDNRRYFLPETQIASNGVFIQNFELQTDRNKASLEASEFWAQVQNLNATQLGSKVYKFGFDQRQGLPYIQFPSDISSLIEDGLSIKYVRTSGTLGNISARTLATLEKPASWSSLETTNGTNDISSEKYSVNNYSVTNLSAAVNGANPETLNSAYWNYQKTVGVFDTLVTCRDYMNKIYQLTDGTAHQKPLVSNVIVSDIRDDINRAFTISTLGIQGVEYTSKPLYQVTRSDGSKEDSIQHFDLLIYPFKSSISYDSADAYNSSFCFDDTNLLEIKQQLEEYKTISHNIVKPASTHIANISVCFRLSAKINTTYKVSSIEASAIEAKAHKALYKAFNMRELTFGTEIPYDSILEVLENSDSRIKSVQLEDPTFSVKLKLVDGSEVEIITAKGDVTDEANTILSGVEKLNAYDLLVLRNVLAGKIALFEYENNFTSDFSEQALPADVFKYNDESVGSSFNYIGSNFKMSNIKQIDAKLNINIDTDDSNTDADKNEITFSENEVLQFRYPNLRTELTYPAYVNYFLFLGGTTPDSSRVIKAKTDYQLKKNEYLLICYSTSDETDEDTLIPISKIYEEGDIIRPNFDLGDSRLKTRYSKKDTSGQYDWKRTKGESQGPITFNSDGEETFGVPGNIIGMHQCATNEQIEIRSIIEEKLDLATAKIFWMRNNEDLLQDSEDSNKLIFEFDEEGKLAYTLKEGEYFYFTDAAAEDFTYYGAGTRIKKSGSTPVIYKYKDSAISAEKINEYGLAAGIPWINYNLSGDDRAITVTEYQYISLSDGDTLKAIKLASNKVTKVTAISNTFITCNSAEYKFANAESSKGLPYNQIADRNWEVRSRLILNAGPVHGQTLRATDKLAQSIILTDNNNNTLTVTPTSDQKVTFKANSLLAGYDRLSLVLYDSDGAESMPIAFKFYKESLPTISTGELDKINTLSTGTLDQGKLTSINFSEYKSQENPLASLNILLPERTIGVLAINYIRNLDDDNIASPFICITDETDTELKIFNNSDWWTESKENGFGKKDAVNSRYHLREGLNLVQFDKSCSIGFYAPIQESDSGPAFTNNDILIFSNLVMIKTSDSLTKLPKLNKKLALKSDTADILDAIKRIDPEMQFYYTIPIDQNSGLDLNEADEEDTLACPKNWFDTNNVNNKFVISKLDTGYLIKNVKVSKYSLR